LLLQVKAARVVLVLVSWQAKGCACLLHVWVGRVLLLVQERWTCLPTSNLLWVLRDARVLLLVDGRAGVTPGDLEILDHLRRSQKPAMLVVNKVDGQDEHMALAEFYGLGAGEPFAISASQGRGVHILMDEVLATFPEPEEETDEVVAQRGICIAIVGRPNVGKSTLVNRMLGEDRVVVYDQPGTTRDSVRIPFERHGQRYTLIDTAGIRKRGKTRETVEKFSVVKSLQSIQEANVVILVIDARTGIVEQDLHLLGYVLDAGRGVVIALNKWDGMELEDKERIKQDIRRRLGFADFARIHFISALHGTGVGDLYRSVQAAWESARRELNTNQLTRLLQMIVEDHAPPMINGRRIKLRYAHAGGHNPPIIVIHGRQTDKLPKHYQRYLEKSFRKALKLEGTPVRIELRSGDNPFVKGEEGLTQQQVSQKRKIARNRKIQRESRK
jgi:GTP-binding protein